MQVSVQLLRVLLVDDEPLIRKGLSSLIDWEAEGYQIAGEASNGNSAINLLKQNDYDLIISDINMPEMNGIELISYVKENKLSKARFVFLSGYNDFEYAKTAIQYGCVDYIVKPIQKDEILATIRKILVESKVEVGCEKYERDFEKAYLDRRLMALLWGKYDLVDLKYVRDKLRFSNEMAYIHCEISLNDYKFIQLTENMKKEYQRKLYNYANLLLKNYKDYIIYNVTKLTDCYEIGILYCDFMAQEKGISQEEWMSWLKKELSERVGFKIVACMGSKVKYITNIKDSFREAILIRSFRFNKKSDNKMLKKEIKSTKNETLKKQLDDLVHYIEINDKFKIKENAKAFYKNMMDKNIDTEVVSRTIDYLLYRLLGLAYKKDADIDQDDIMQYIRETVFSANITHKNIYIFEQFVLEYADYLSQLKLDTATCIIDHIENEIEENYAEGLSLKSLGEKYYINSAYLGQIFKKKYGCSFKDHLNNVRIRKAAELLLNTDKKVYEIAVDVGYKNQEYFINKFEEIYKVTPTRLRKRNLK